VVILNKEVRKNMKTSLRLTIAAFVLAAFNLSAATLYVSLESTNPAAPFATWATAANVIQHAVDAAKAGDTVLVTNGVYKFGERETSVLDTYQEPPQPVSAGKSRVVITNSIKLESVNGPLLTSIEGGLLLDELGHPTNGVRCVFLGTNAVLSGFTFTNGTGTGNWPRNGGGVYCTAPDAVLTNCVLTGNCASCGGGAFGGTLYNCILTGNWTDGMIEVAGGGAFGGTLYNCTLTGNRIDGAYACTLYSCTLSGNSMGPEGGGGAGACTLYNCTLTGNRGFGAQDCALYNCTLTDNGWGASGSSLYNCTLTDNGYGAGACTLYNSIVYYNSGGNYDEWTIMNFSCTTPIPTNGVGNITGPPFFMDMSAGDFRLWEESPCIDAGTNLVGFAATNQWEEFVAYTHEPTDMLGNTRFIDGNFDGTVAWDIGAYEFNSFKPPRFTVQPQLTADGWRLVVSGAPNEWVRVQTSSNLKDWEYVWLRHGNQLSTAVFMGAEGVQEATDVSSGTGEKMMFYRVVVE
jgi:hypothetical protein